MRINLNQEIIFFHPALNVGPFVAIQKPVENCRSINNRVDSKRT